MPQSNDAGALWRLRAEEARAHAQQITDPQVRSALLKIAESYEHRAAVAERGAVAAKAEP